MDSDDLRAIPTSVGNGINVHGNAEMTHFKTPESRDYTIAYVARLWEQSPVETRQPIAPSIAEIEMFIDAGIADIGEYIAEAGYPVALLAERGYELALEARGGPPAPPPDFDE